MTDQARKFLLDMLDAIALAELFSADTPTFQSHQNDPKTKSAVERQLEILGEAVKKFSREALDFQLNNVSQIISFRNRLAHNYDQIDDAIVWAVLKRHLPELKSQVEALVK